jgi:hypothetical protein
MERERLNGLIASWRIRSVVRLVAIQIHKDVRPYFEMDGHGYLNPVCGEANFNFDRP